jgi:hypothetical protein
MRWLYDNKFDAYDILSATTELANFPSSNTQNIHTSTRWRTTAETAQAIVIDAGAGNTITADCIAIAGHNLSSGATIKFQMHTSDAWGAPDLDETITYRSGIMIKFFTSTAKRFIRFYFDDAANTDGYIEIGRLFAGTYFQVDPSSLSEFPIRNIRNDIVFDTDTNNTYGTEVTGWREFSYGFPPTDYTQIAGVRTMWNTIGKFKPFFMLNYDTRFTEIEPAYCRIISNFDEDWKGHNKISYNFEFREVV